MDALFPELEGTTQWPPWFTPGTTTPAAHKVHVARGRHPFGLPLLHARGEGTETCGSCAHRCTHTVSRTYHKCGLMPRTSGPGTDLRLSWAACMRYQPEDQG